MAGTRLDLDISADESYSLSHAGEPEAPPGAGLTGIEAHAIVLDGELQTTRHVPQAHLGPARAGVACDIA